jgi:hypothetical protein
MTTNLSVCSVLSMKTMAVTHSEEYTDARAWSMAMIHELEIQERRGISQKSGLSMQLFRALADTV